MQLTRCNQMIPSRELFGPKERPCGARLVVEGEGVDELRRCPECKAQWTMDGKAFES